MTTRIGINGFGRMGRLALRAAWGWPGIGFAHINELEGDSATAAHLLVFDSVHGRWSRQVATQANGIEIDGQLVGYTDHAAPGEVPWKQRGVDIVLECTGKFRTQAQLAAYFEQGVKKVIVAAPVKEGALNVVVG